MRRRDGYEYDGRFLNVSAAGTISIGGDLTVNRLGFGAMRVTGQGIWGEPRDLDEARAVLRRVVEGGVTFIDTADSYGPYVSEQLIGEALYPYNEENLVIATKGELERPGAGRLDEQRQAGAPAGCLRGKPAASATGADPVVPVAPTGSGRSAGGFNQRPGECRRGRIGTW